MWILQAQVLFKNEYASIPKNDKLLGMPYISNVLGLLAVRIFEP